jgi:Putative Actinobacterial Holin-X, holin superfamily III
MSEASFPDSPPSAASASELVNQAAAQISTLVRDELALAKLELTERASVPGWAAATVFRNQTAKDVNSFDCLDRYRGHRRHWRWHRQVEVDTTVWAAGVVVLEISARPAAGDAGSRSMPSPGTRSGRYAPSARCRRSLSAPAVGS